MRKNSLGCRASRDASGRGRPRSRRARSAGGLARALNKFTILPFDREAAENFHRLQTQLSRLGTMDLKIAAICLAHEATLLSRNLVDFERSPGLRVENWLD